MSCRLPVQIPPRLLLSSAWFSYIFFWELLRMTAELLLVTLVCYRALSCWFTLITLSSSDVTLRSLCLVPSARIPVLPVVFRNFSFLAASLPSHSTVWSTYPWVQFVLLRVISAIAMLLVSQVQSAGTHKPAHLSPWFLAHVLSAFPLIFQSSNLVGLSYPLALFSTSSFFVSLPLNLPITF